MYATGGGGGPGGGGGGSFIHYDALDISKEVGHEGHGSAEVVYVAPSARSLRTQVNFDFKSLISRGHGALGPARQPCSCSAAWQAVASWHAWSQVAGGGPCSLSIALMGEVFFLLHGSPPQSVSTSMLSSSGGVIVSSSPRLCPRGGLAFSIGIYVAAALQLF